MLIGPKGARNRLAMNDGEWCSQQKSPWNSKFFLVGLELVSVKIDSTYLSTVSF